MATLDNSFVVEKKTKHATTMYLEIILLEIYSGEIKLMFTHKNLYIAALFLVAKIQEQSRCPSTGKS